MPDFAVPASVIANQQTRALARRPMPCGEGVGRGLTCNRYPAVLYPRGHRCGPCAQRAGLQPIATELTGAAKKRHYRAGETCEVCRVNVRRPA